MAGHFYNAQKLGIKHMFITDHDSRMGRKKVHIDSFDFTKRKLRIDEYSQDVLRPKSHGFDIDVMDENCDVHFTDKDEICLSAKSKTSEWSTVASAIII